MTVCSAECEANGTACSIYDPNICCDLNCVGGCTGPLASDCLVCKKVVTFTQNKACRAKCAETDLEVSYFKLAHIIK